MAKGFAVFGMVVAIVFVLVFGLDLAIGIPFSTASWLADTLFILASLALGYMSFVTFREQS
jgi:hypothetical protein